MWGTDCEVDGGEREVEVPGAVLEHEVEGVWAGLQEVTQAMKGEKASRAEFRSRVRGQKAYYLPFLGEKVLRQRR